MRRQYVVLFEHCTDLIEHVDLLPHEVRSWISVGEAVAAGEIREKPVERQGRLVGQRPRQVGDLIWHDAEPPHTGVDLEMDRGRSDSELSSRVRQSSSDGGILDTGGEAILHDHSKGIFRC